MRGSDNGITTALARARADGLVPRRLVTIWARSLADGEVEQFCFWDGLLPVDIEVVTITGDIEERAFAADGALIEVGKIRLTSDLTIRPATFRLNRQHERVKLMEESYDVRLAPVEIHRVPLNPRTGLLVSRPHRRFRGFVETKPSTGAAVGSDGSLTFNCISDTVQLTITNPLKRSDESQKRRAGDRMMRYAALAPDWEVSWGEAEGTIK